MPRLTRTQNWVKFFREQVNVSTAGHFKVLDSRGKMRLQYRPKGERAQSLMLPFEFSKSETIKALPRIQQIFKTFIQAKGRKTLSHAASLTEASSSKHEIPWAELMTEYRKYVPNAGDKTWKWSYTPVLNRAGLLMQRTKGKPNNGELLMLKSLEQWEQGSRSRQIARRSLKGFLEWAVMRGKLPAAYAPPASIPEIKKPKRIGFALTDSQILRLLDDISDERWKFAIQLCAVYGLRHEELRYLGIKDGAEGKGGEALKTHLRRENVWNVHEERQI